MRNHLLVFLTLGLWLQASAADYGTASASAASGPSGHVVYVPGSSRKICQLTGETDLEVNRPTLSQTESRYGLTRTDNGSSFEHNGKLYFLFGDSNPAAKFNGKPDGQTDPPRIADDNDAIGVASDTSMGPCIKLDFIADSIGAFKNPVVLNAQGKPAITLRTNETPVAGVSDAGRMFVIFGTDNFLSNPPGGASSPNGGSTRTVVAVSDDNASTFHYLYNFSVAPGAKFIFLAIAKGQDGYIYFWGAQGDTMFRKSAPFLARKPIGSMADSTQIQYLHAVNADGSPVFMPHESDAAPLFHDSLPGPSGQMTVADDVGEVGVEWNPFVKHWIMLYNSSNNTAANPRGIYMRYADYPWGPWSQPQTIFNAVRDSGLCRFIHRAVTPSQPACDSLSSADRLADGGGNYSPYFISRFTSGDSLQGTSSFYYVVSTWNPYQVVIMQSSIQLLPDTSDIPRPTGIYVLNDAANERAARSVYATGLTTAPAYQNAVTGHAIFVPVAKILPSIATWGQFNWQWGYVDTLVQAALANNKKFSIELETGFQTTSTYLQSLPAGFATAAGPNSAPLFDVWATGGSGGQCISAFIPLPWIPRVQEFWDAAASALAAHLKAIGAYSALTLVHVPGLSVYDEELRLPTGNPQPTSSDTGPCPDGRPAYPTVMNDATAARWQGLGYADSAVISGFSAITRSFARAFPDKYLGLSLFPLGTKGIDFPNLTGDTVGYVTGQIVKAVSAIAPGRIQVQADMLDVNLILPEVTNLASMYHARIGWQTNKHGQTGAGCNNGGAGSCDPDGPSGPYYQLLKTGAQNGGEYVEVWSTDVVAYPQSFAAAKSSGLYELTGVEETIPTMPSSFVLQQNYPNPFNPSTVIRYGLPYRVHVTLSVFNILGQVVATLVNAENEAGYHEVRFDARNLASGIYFYRLVTGSFTETRKLMVLR